NPSKVITNADLRPAPSPSAAAAAAPRADAKTDQKKEAAEKEAPAKDGAAKDAATPKELAQEPVKDQAYWSGRVKALQEQLSRDETYADALQSRINALTTDFVNRDDPA